MVTKGEYELLQTRICNKVADIVDPRSNCMFLSVSILCWLIKLKHFIGDSGVEVGPWLHSSEVTVSNL